MKPTKNKVFCQNCGRTKMLFESEKKADNFIAFNQEEIKTKSGYAPERSYFCLFCGGWHITSIKEEIGKSKNEKLLENYLKKEPKNTVKKIVAENNKVNIDEKQSNRISEVESQITGLASEQMEIYFSEQINSLKKETEDLKNSDNQLEKEKLKDLRQELEIIYIVRKQYGFHKTNNSSEKLKESEREEWKLWLKNNGYDIG